MTIEEATESIQLFRAAVAYMRSSGKPVPTLLELADLKAEAVLPVDLTHPHLFGQETANPRTSGYGKSDAIHAVPRITEVSR